MKKYAACIIMFCAILCFHGCRESSEKSAEGVETKIITDDSLSINLIADTIIYDVIIKNTDPDNKWIEKCLGNLNRSELVDQLFDAVYDNKANAYNFFSGKKLRPADLKRIEKDKDFNRSKIGKLQFTEAWYYDPPKLLMQKRIISITLGHELPGNDGNIIGYKPVFKVYLN